jgi:hypothetical protein
VLKPRRGPTQTGARPTRTRLGTASAVEAGHPLDEIV